MSNLNNRIYEELNEWKYAQCILTEYSLIERNKLKILNAILIFISIVGIAGWLRYEEYKILWSVILMIAQGIRLIQNMIIISNEDLFNIKNSIVFYTYNLFDLENLYYDYYKGKYTDNYIEKKLNKLRDKERTLFSKQTFDKIKSSGTLITTAEKETDKYLQKIIKNVTHE